MELKTFKQLVKMLAEVNSADDAWEVECEVKKSFEHDKISWADHELIYSILGKVDYVGKYAARRAREKQEAK